MSNLYTGLWSHLTNENILFVGRNGGKTQKELAAQAAADAAAGGAVSDCGDTAMTPDDSTAAPEATPAATTPKAPKKELGSQGPQNIQDPGHWSKQEKYDADAYLEGAYKKHLSRHANK